MSIDARILAVGAALGLAAAASAPTLAKAHSDSPPDVTVKQEAGKTVYWVTPGPVALDPRVFGTPDNPKRPFSEIMAEAKQMVADGKAPPTLPQLVMDAPILFGAPDKGRKVTADGRYMFAAPTPFGNDGRIVQGSFEAEYWDNVAEDPPGPPGKTDDKAKMEATFSDPAGNEYRVVLDHVVKPPFPGYETGGGVVTDRYLHGATGDGTPLMPQMWTVGAFWGIADLYMNGELIDDSRVIHMMTTEVVRDKNYNLVQEQDLPVQPDDRLVAGQPHHTHLILPPVSPRGGKGPQFSPTPNGFELPNGKKQPFIHIMYEEDTIVR